MDPRVELAQTLLFQGAWTRTARPHKSHQALQSSHKEDRAHSPATRPAGPTPSSQLCCTLGTLSLGRAAARAAHQRPHRSTGTAGDRHTDTRAHRCTQGLIDTWTHVDTHVDTDTWTQICGHTRRRIGGRTHKHTWTHRHVGSRFPWAVTQPKPSLAAGAKIPAARCPHPRPCQVWGRNSSRVPGDISVSAGTLRNCLCVGGPGLSRTPSRAFSSRKPAWAEGKHSPPWVPWSMDLKGRCCCLPSPGGAHPGAGVPTRPHPRPPHWLPALCPRPSRQLPREQPRSRASGHPV